MRKPIIVGNWKMNNGPQEAHDFMHELEHDIVGKKIDIDWAIAPPSIAIPYMMPHSHGNSAPFKIPLAVQNVNAHEKGAFTGEISISMIEQLGVKYAIVGHSERRELFGETDTQVNEKVKALLKSSVTPILAFGEPLDVNLDGKTLDWVKNQLDLGLEGVYPADLSKVVLAYEPIWAIGAGKTATAKQAQEIIKEIREHLAQRFNEEAAQSVRIQYGGSVTPDNIKELMEQPDIDGALVGGASLKPDSFAKLITFNK